MCCMLHSCCSPHDHCGTLINTHSLMDTEHLSGDERLGWMPDPSASSLKAWRQHRHRCSGLTSNGDYTEGRVWLMLWRHTFKGPKKSPVIFYQKFILVRAAHLPQLISILSGYFWRIKTLFVSLCIWSPIWDVLSLMTGCSHLWQSPHLPVLMCHQVPFVLTNQRPVWDISANQRTGGEMIDKKTVIKDRRPIIKAISNHFFSQPVLFSPKNNKTRSHQVLI